MAKSKKHRSAQARTVIIRMPRDLVAFYTEVAAHAGVTVNHAVSVSLALMAVQLRNAMAPK